MIKNDILDFPGGPWTPEEMEEFIDQFPIRTELEVLPADEPKQIKLGFIMEERLGIGVTNIGRIKIIC